MARWPRTLSPAALLAACTAALLVLPGATAQANSVVTSSSGNVDITVGSSSVPLEFWIHHGAMAVNLMPYNTPAPEGGGWAACFAPDTPNTCICPDDMTTCPVGYAGTSSSYTAGGGQYHSVHAIGNLVVTHDWTPAGTTSPYNEMVQVNVTLQNQGGQTMPSLHYRRGQGFIWSGENPVSCCATMSIGTNDAAAALQTLYASSDMGRASPMPGSAVNAAPDGAAGTCGGSYTIGPGSASGGPWFNHVAETDSHLPCTPGGLADLDLGDLAPGQSVTFRMHFGKAPGESEALYYVGPNVLGADFWFLAQSNNLNNAANGGAPFTVFWAFSGLPNSACTTGPCNGGGSCPAAPCGPPGNGTGGSCTNPPCGPPGNGTGGCPPTPNCSPPGNGGNGGNGCPSTPNCPPGNSGNSTCTPNQCQSTPYGCAGCEPSPYPEGAYASPSGSSYEAPSASFQSSSRTTTRGEGIAFSDASSDADGLVVSWSWDFGDGSTATDRSVSHQWSQPGRYTVRLTVMDDRGLSSQATMVIDVQDAAGASAALQAPDGPTSGAPAGTATSRIVSSIDGCSGACGSGLEGSSPVGRPPAEPQASGAAFESSRALPLMLAAAALGLVGLVGVAAASRRRWMPFAVFLFSRLRRNDLLDHPVRSQLAELVEAEPGLHVQELARRTGRSRSDVQHHLRVLAKAGILKALQGAGLVRYFPGQVAAPTELAPGPAARRILDVVAQRAGMGYGAAHYHVRRLERSGRVELRGDPLQVFSRAAAGTGDGVAAAS